MHFSTATLKYILLFFSFNLAAIDCSLHNLIMKNITAHEKFGFLGLAHLADAVKMAHFSVLTVILSIAVCVWLGLWPH